MKLLRTNYLLFLLMPMLVTGCKKRFFRASSASMEATIPAGAGFWVTQTKKFQRNDIAVIDHYGPDYSLPLNEDGTYKLAWIKKVYRIVALSGDTLTIINGDIIVNGKLLPVPPKALFTYEIKSTVPIDDFPERNDWTNQISSTGTNTFTYRVSLTKAEAAAYSLRKPAVVSVSKIPAVFSNEDSFYAKECTGNNWTTDNYGPLYIPKPGDVITVMDCNRKLYKNIHGIQTGRNVIKENLFFLVGDNRHFAEDSRYIGLISHSKMYGIVKK